MVRIGNAQRWPLEKRRKKSPTRKAPPTSEASSLSDYQPLSRLGLASSAGHLPALASKLSALISSDV
jgi:hypothetical protein